MNKHRNRVSSSVEREPVNEKIKRSRIRAVLTKYGIPADYVSSMLEWLSLAAYAREHYVDRLPRFKPHLETLRPLRDWCANWLAEFERHPEYVEGLRKQGAPVDDVIKALRENIGNFEDRYYNPSGKVDLFTGIPWSVHAGVKKSGATFELEHLLLDAMPMWKDVKGEWPKVQSGHDNKPTDEEGTPADQPFIQMMDELLEAAGKHDLRKGLKSAAKEVLKHRRARRDLETAKTDEDRERALQRMLWKTPRLVSQKRKKQAMKRSRRG